MPEISYAACLKGGTAGFVVQKHGRQKSKFAEIC